MCKCFWVLVFFGGDVGASDGEYDAVIAYHAYGRADFYGASIFGDGLPAVAVDVYSSGFAGPADVLGHGAITAYQGVHIAGLEAAMSQ